MKPEPIMPEKYVREVLVLVEQAGDHRDKLRDMKDATIEEQMRFFEESEIAALAAFKRGFAKLLVDLPIEVARREQRAFLHMIRTILHDVKDIVRKWFRTNHYYTMKGAEWEAYCKTKKQTLHHIVSEAFDMEWISEIIPREALYAIGEQERECLAALVDTLLDRAHQISVRQNEMAVEEKAIYSARVLKVAGYDPYKLQEC